MSRWTRRWTAHYLAPLGNVIDAQVARTGENWSIWFEVITFSAFRWIFDEIKNAAKVRANSAVGNNIPVGQFDDVTGNFPCFFAFRIVLKVALFEVKWQTSPSF